MRFAKRNNIGDISGKNVSGYTTSSLIGIGLGIGLSKLIDISQLYQLTPVFALLSSVNFYCTYASVDLVNEIYLNN